MKWLLITALIGFSATQRWDFERDGADAAPAGFVFAYAREEGAPAKWSVIADGDSHILAQLDDQGKDGRFPLAVVDQSSARNLKLSVRIKAVSGTKDQTGGLLWRYQDPHNHLVARLDVLDRDVKLYRIVNGNRIKFGEEKDLKVRAGKWYTLRIEHKGERIKVYLDDDMLFDERDRHFTRPGKVGVWTKGDSVTYFDDLTLRDLDKDDDDD
jgi:hypothetical protein